MRKSYRLVKEDEVPDVRQIGLYDLIVDEFLNSPDDLVSVEIDGREPAAIYQGLNYCIKRRNLERKVSRFIRETKVYLMKIV